MVRAAQCGKGAVAGWKGGVFATLFVTGNLVHDFLACWFWGLEIGPRLRTFQPFHFANSLVLERQPQRVQFPGVSIRRDWNHARLPELFGSSLYPWWFISVRCLSLVLQHSLHRKMAGRLSGTARQGFGCQVKLGKGSFKWMDQEGWISWFQCATLQIMICQSYPESARSTRFAPRCSLPRLPMRWQTLWLHWNGAGLGSGQCSKFREMEHQEGTFKLHLFSSCILYEMKCFSLHIHSVQRNYSQTSQGLCWFGQ